MAIPRDAWFQYGKHCLAYTSMELTEEAAYDPSGVDQIGIRFVMKVKGHLSMPLCPGTGAENATQILNRIQHDMLRPRQYLVCRNAGTKVIEVGTPEDAENNRQVLDLAGGPKPISLRVISWTEATIQIEFTIETTVLDCDSDVTKNRGFLSNRWKEIEHYDKFGYCNYEVVGLLIVRADIQVNPDQMRTMAMSRIRPGYQRDNWSFEIEETGTRMTYRYIDQEKYRMPAAGTLEMKCRLGFATASTGVTAAGHLSMVVKGKKSTTKRDLLIAMSNIYGTVVDRFRVGGSNEKAPLNKLHLEGELIEENMLMLNAQFTVDLKKIMPGAGGRERKSTLAAAKEGAKIGTLIGGPIGTVVGAVNGIALNELRKTDEPAVPMSSMFKFFDYDIFEFPLPGCGDSDQDGIAPRVRGNNKLLTMLSATFYDPCYKTPERPVASAELRQSAGSSVTAGLDDAINATIAGGSTLPNSSAFSDTGGLPLPALFKGGPATPLNSFGSVDGPGDAVAKHPTLADSPYPEQGTQPARIAIVENVGDPFSPLVDEPPPYQLYQCNIDYIWKGGNAFLNSTKLGEPRQVVAVTNPSLDLKVSWTAERIGERPEIPDMCAEDSNIRLSHFVVSPDIMCRAVAGGYRFTITGVYYYAVLKCDEMSIFEAVPPFILADLRGISDEQLAMGAVPYKKRTDGLYTLVGDVLWFRLKTKEARGAFFRVCPCDEVTTEAEIRQSAGEGVERELRGSDSDDGFTLRTSP
ncbi:hypothetical protein BH11PLA2_BH11PLA2_01820 [soil metagenome]